MGEVFLAWDDRLRRQVAIKRIRADLPVTDGRRRRFRLEARAAAGLGHPAIVQVHDILEEPTGDAIVMEYVEGRTLAVAMRHGSIDVATALDYGRQIAEGLTAAHAQGFLHRDLKAQNVMVTPEGRCKILDFGLAKHLHGLDDSITRDGAILGTLRTMSPEQASGGEVDVRTDLYALGVILYEILTGHPVFRGESAKQVAFQVVTTLPPPLRALRPELPLQLCQLVDSLLAKDPVDRPSRATEVVEVLADLADQPEIYQLKSVRRSTRQHAGSDDPTQHYASTEPLSLPHAESLGVDTAVPRFEESSAINRWRPGARMARWSIALLGLACLVALLASINQTNQTNQTAPTGPATEMSLVATLAPTPYELCQEGFQYLDHYYRDGYLEKAIATFEQAIAAKPDYALAFSGLGRTYRQLFRRKRDKVWLTQALSSARRAVELEPQLTHARVTLAWVWTAHGDFELAAQELEALQSLDPLNADVHRALAHLAAADNRQEDAIRHGRDAIRLAPDSWPLHAELGILLQKSGQYEQAAEAFEAATRLAPNNPVLHLNLGAIYYFKGLYDEAASAFQKSIEIHPYASTYSNLGTLYFFRGKYREAAEVFERAVELDANKYLHWANLGDAYRALPDRHDLAAEAFLRATQLLEDQLREHPQNTELRSRLALYQSKRGHCPAALEIASALEPVESHVASTQYRIALAYELCNDRDRALRALEMALAAGYALHEVRQEPDLVHLREDVRFHRLALRFRSES
jgi:serine/threonine-protein kinase